MTRIGASSHSNASSWMMAARLWPIPPGPESPWTMGTLWQGGVGGAKEAYRRVEPFERLFLDDGGEALADPAGHRVLVDDEHFVAVARDGPQHPAIERREAPQIEHARLDPLLGQRAGHAKRDVHVGAVRHD